MPGEQILIVDDTPLNLKLLSVLLAAKGYEVSTATSAEEANEILRVFRPDLLLLDIRLPGLDGLAFTRQLRADPMRAGLIIVAVTASAMRGDEEAALTAGFDGYITKPIDTRVLPTLVAEYLARGRRT
ncbi:MAG: response regulator receiver protein [Myxococcales bacterium]|nr:response regulator receiver protein [Myxococcales bacterium]